MQENSKSRFVNIVKNLKMELVQAESVTVYWKNTDMTPKELYGEIWYGPGVVDGEHHIFQKLDDEEYHYSFNRDDVSYLEVLGSSLTSEIFA